MSGRELVLGEEEVRALKTLVEVAVKLKESGILDMLRVIAEKGWELFSYFSNDLAVNRAIAIGDAAAKAIERLNPETVIALRRSVEAVTGCSLKALASVDPGTVRPVSALGLLRALGDRDVQVGLGLLVAVAKALGSCIRGGGSGATGQG